MRSVKWLKEQLEKLPDDAMCFAYEGEDTGIVAILGLGKYVFIPCKELANEKPDSSVDPLGHDDIGTGQSPT
jgi:hypothetical protein